MVGIERLEKELSRIAGNEVTITVRGDKEFTFSTENADQDLEFHMVSYFGKLMVIDAETQIDDECGTFVYMRAA
jgi:hypothetical protein